MGSMRVPHPVRRYQRCDACTFCRRPDDALHLPG
jgi:hypothetical protein